MELIVDRRELIRHTLLTEEWTHKEVSKTIQPFMQRVRRHIKEVGGAVIRGEGVVGATASFDELIVVIFGGILLRAHEEHMLTEVRQSIQIHRILRKSNLHREGGARLRLTRSRY